MLMDHGILGFANHFKSVVLKASKTWDDNISTPAIQEGSEYNRGKAVGFNQALKGIAVDVENVAKEYVASLVNQTNKVAPLDLGLAVPADAIPVEGEIVNG